MNKTSFISRIELDENFRPTIVRFSRSNVSVFCECNAKLTKIL